MDHQAIILFCILARADSLYWPHRDLAGGTFPQVLHEHFTAFPIASSGVHPKTAQELMRHSDINLTMGIYTHTNRDELKTVVDDLPDFEKQAQIMTGTDDKPADAIGDENHSQKHTEKNTDSNGKTCLKLTKAAGK